MDTLNVGAKNTNKAYFFLIKFLNVLYDIVATKTIFFQQTYADYLAYKFWRPTKYIFLYNGNPFPHRNFMTTNLVYKTFLVTCLQAYIPRKYAKETIILDILGQIETTKKTYPQKVQKLEVLAYWKLKTKYP